MHTVTIYDVAKRAGVSPGTVSNVLNNSNKVTNKTTQKVLNAMSELNYVPNVNAQILKTNNSRIIGIIAEDITICFTSSIIDGICDYCEKNNYTINLCNLSIERKMAEHGIKDYETFEKTDPFKESLNKSITSLLSSRICSLIYIGSHPRNVSGLLPKLSIPVVYVYAYTKDNDFCVNYDDYQGAQLAMDYLIRKGHSRIALISGPVNSIPTHKRILAYQSTLLKNDIAFCPEYIKTGNWTYQDGYEKCLELLQLPDRPTAIFAMNDVMALGALNALESRRLKVPEDIALHGFDNLYAAQYAIPSITTVDLPLHQLGLTAVKTLNDLLDNVPPQCHGILLPCTHIPRASA